MQPNWLSALVETATYPQGSLEQAREAARAALAGDVAAPLTDQGLIHVTGADAASFLHAQLSNSIEDMAEGDTRLAAWCSPKGRTLALFRVVAAPDGFLILLDRSLVANTLKRLRLFVLRSDVTLNDRSDDWASLGFSGEGALAAVGSALAPIPETPETVRWVGSAAIIRLPGSTPRAVVTGPVAALTELWQTATHDLTLVATEAWHLLLIRDGEPTISESTGDAFVPQMLNLEPLGGLSFTKGCYPGQEVVARLHYRGQLKRRLYRLALPVTEPPEPGTELDNAAGTIVDAAQDGEAVEALAVIGVDTAAAGGIRYDGEPVQFRDLPYEMPS